MKKIYFFFITMLICCVGSFAESPSAMTLSKKMYSTLQGTTATLSESTPPADLGGNFSSWEKLGTGHFNAELGILDECDVTVWHCTTDPGGMGVDSWYFDGIMDGLRLAAMPFIDYYNISSNNTGKTYKGKKVLTDELSSHYNVGMSSGYDETLGLFSFAILYYVDDPDVTDNVITFGIETVQLDGDFKDFRTSLDIAGESRSEKKLKVNPGFVDAVDVKVCCYRKEFSVNKDGTPGVELLAAISAQSKDLSVSPLATSDPCYFDLSEDGIYTVIMTYKGENNENGYLFESYEYDSQWEEFGVGDFTDDYLASYYTDFPIKTACGLKVQKKIGKEIYRIINPYSSDDTWTSEWSRLKVAEPETNSYFVINAENPEKVYIYINPIDITDGDGIRLVVGSAAHYNIINGRSDEVITEKGYWGTVNWSAGVATVTFPQTSLMMRPANSPYPLFANMNSGFKAVLKKSTAGVDNIIIDSDNNTAAEYYNLQGVRVENPTAGTLYIRRQGNNVSKVVMK